MVLCEKLLHIVAIAQMCEKLDDVLLGLFVVFAFDNEIELVIFTPYYLCVRACAYTCLGLCICIFAFDNEIELVIFFICGCARVRVCIHMCWFMYLYLVYSYTKMF